MGTVMLYLGGLLCTIGWILAIVVAVTAGGGFIAILFAVIAGPLFMWIEALWWSEWIPVLFFYPGYLVYYIGTKITGQY